MGRDNRPFPRGGSPILVVLLPIIPCLVVAPIAIVFVGIILPLWAISLLLTAVAWLLVAPLDMIARLVGVTWLQSARGNIERALHHLTHPQIPDRFRKKR